jgi:hypothetical protein
LQQISAPDYYPITKETNNCLSRGKMNPVRVKMQNASSIETRFGNGNFTSGLSNFNIRLIRVWLARVALPEALRSA